jgi:large subunit ribosomal protein L7/L12
MFRKQVGADERLVVFRKGKLHRIEGPGEALTVPVLEQAMLVSLRPVRQEIALAEAQADGGFVSAKAVMEWAVLQPEKACLQMAIAPLGPSLTELAIAAYRAVAIDFKVEQLDDPGERTLLGRAVKKAVNETALEWGVDVLAVEITALETVASPVRMVDWASVPSEEQTDVCNVLLRETGANIIEVIRVLRRLTGWDLAEARSQVELVPVVVLKRVRRAEAEEMERALEAVGARVELM